MSLDRFVGLPWRERGRGEDGCDCWGLVLLVYRALLGVELPSHAEDYQTVADREAVAELFQGGLGAWTEIPAGTERALDVVQMRRWHVGVVERPGRLLHMPRRLTSRLELYRQGQQGPVRFFRHRSQIAS